MPERVKKTKCGGGGVVLREKIEGGVRRERVKKMKCGGLGLGGWRVKIGGRGHRSHKKI